jgi:hypothetical protein
MKRKALTGIYGCFVLLFFAEAGWTVPVPDTGQTTCYDVAGNVIICPSPGQALYGQDVNYNINPMSYTKLDGSGNALASTATEWIMVRDNVTGLIWEMKNGKDGIKNYNNPRDADNTYTWYDSNPATNGGYAGTSGNGTDTEDFIKALNDVHYGGYSDWRIPSVKELASIVNHSLLYPGPTIDSGYFPNTQGWYYWSSTTDVSSAANAWGVSFIDGYDGSNVKSSSGYVRAVRGGRGSLDDASVAAGSYTVNGDGTVTDAFTGLMWQQAGSSNTMSWENALAYSESLATGDFTDWRLPTIKELRSLVDYTHDNPSINTKYFPNTSPFYWSSTTYEIDPGLSRGVDFLYGSSSISHKAYIYYARAVRGGQPVSYGNLLITSPSQADTWAIGSQKAITWLTQGFGEYYGYVKISISRDGGKNYTVITDTAQNFGYYGVYNWTVTGPTSVNCMIKAEPLTALNRGTIQGLFTIEKPELLAASFAGSGLWVYNSYNATWMNINPITPENMVYSGLTLYASFGGYGLWKWDGTAWAPLTWANPESMVTSDSALYADFGVLGLWKWDGAVWILLTWASPERMMTSGSALYASCSGLGLWKWDGTAWAQLTPTNPENMVTAGPALYADFGGQGLWRWDGTAWTPVTRTNPENMVTAGSTLYGDFGASGLWKRDGTVWVQLSPANPENMVTSGSSLYADFGGSGLWKYDVAGLIQLSPANPENMVTSGPTLYADFGEIGLWRWNGTAFSILTASSPDKMAGSN